MYRPILYGIFPITVASGIGYHNIGSGGIRAGAYVTSITAPSDDAAYGYAVQSQSGANLFIKKNLTGDWGFSDLYAVTTNGRLIIAGTDGDYEVEIWIYDDAKLG